MITFTLNIIKIQFQVTKSKAKLMPIGKGRDELPAAKQSFW